MSEEKIVEAEKKILLIDDDQASQKSLSFVLKRKKYNVVGVKTGKEALDALKEEFFHVALLDIMLPDVQGIDLLPQMKELRPDMVVIMVTGNASLENAVKSLNLGASGYVIKPIDIDKLLVTLSDSLAKQSLILENKQLYEEVQKELSKRIKIENTLKESEKRYRQIFNNAAVSIWEEDFSRLKEIVDDLRDKKIENIRDYLDKHKELVEDAIKSSRKLDVNETTLKMYGATSKEELLVPYGEHLTPETIEWFKYLMGAVFEGADFFEKDGVNKKIDGRLINVMISIKIPKSKEEFKKLSLVVTDITERIKAENYLKESEERLQTIMNSLQVGIVIIEPETHKIIDVNPMAEQMIGDARKDILGKVCHSYMCPAETAKCPITDLGQQIENSERVLIKANGKKIPVLKTVVSIKMRGKDFIVDSFVDIAGWKQSEKALRESEQRLELAVSGADLGLWDWDIANDVLIIDERWAGMIGYTVKELPPSSKTWGELLHPDDKESTFKELERHFKQETAFYMVDFRLKTKNGAWKWIQGRGKVVARSDSGDPLRMVGTHLDLSERKVAEEALQWELDVNTALAKLSHALIDTEIKIDEVSNTVLESSRQLTGSEYGYVGTIDQRTGNLVVHTFSKMMDQCKISAEEQTIEFSKSEDGSYPALFGHVLNTRRPIYTNDPKKHSASTGIPKGHIALKNFLSTPTLIGDSLVGQIAVANSPNGYTDIQLDAIMRLNELFALAIQRFQEEEQLEEYSKNLELMVEKRTNELKRSLYDTREARDRIDVILKSVADGMLVTDKYNNVILMNNSAEELLGIRFSEVINRPIGYALPKGEMNNNLLQSLETLQAFQKVDFTVADSRGGEDRILEARISKIFDREGDENGIVTILHDVTHEREVDRMKTEFISTAAHELRTPLTSIMGFSEILLTRDNLKTENKNKYLQYINTQSVKLAKIIGDLLDISRIESGRGFELNRTKFNISELAEQVVSVFKDQSEKHTFTIATNDNPEIYGDSEKIERVLKNLVSNAVKYSPNGGEISIKGLMKGDNYHMTVSDKGLGMTKAQVEKVFDKFYRVDASDTAIEGTGLGMSIVKYIIEAHGGNILVKSVPGKGTDVMFTLPQNV